MLPETKDSPERGDVISGKDSADDAATAPFQNLLDRRQRFYVVGLLLFLFACGIHFNDIKSAEFGTHDERDYSLQAWTFKNGGVPVFTHYAYAMAAAQGRIGYMWVALPAYVLYLLDPGIRPVYISAIQIGAYVSVALFLSFVVGRLAAMLALVFFLCFGVHAGSHYPDVANPVFFHLGVGAFFLGCTLQIWQRRLFGGWRRSALAIAIFLMVFWSMGVYEAQDVGCAIVEAAILCWVAREFRRSGQPRPILQSIRAEAPVLIAVAGYFAVYIGWRLIHPSTYDGTRLGSESLHLGTVIRAWAAYTISALPGANIFFGSGAALVHGELSEGVSWAHFFQRHFSWTEFILGSGIAIIVWMFISDWAVLWGREAGSRTQSAGTGQQSWSLRGRGIALVALMVGVALATQLPLALVPKYNQNLAWAPHVPSFYAFLCFCVGVPAALLAMAAGPIRFRKTTATICALLAFGLLTVSREVSAMVISFQSRDCAPTELMEAFLKTKLFASVPDGSTIVAPSLWESATLVLPLDSGYWEAFLNLRTGRHLHVMPGLPGRGIRSRLGGTMYYLEQQTPASDGTVLLLSPLRLGTGEGVFSSDSLSVISNQSLAGKDVAFVVSSNDRLAGVNSGVLQTVGLPGEYDGHVFTSTVSIPDGFIPGSAFVVSGGTGSIKMAGLHWESYTPMQFALAGKVRIVFGNGFSGLEKQGGHYWHWSDAPSGTGEITFWNQTERSLDAAFDACISTGYPRPSRLVLTFNGKSDVSSANNVCAPVSRKWRLEPGKNSLSIHSDAARFPTGPTDRRHIVFGVYDWKLHESGPVIESEKAANDPLQFDASGKVRVEFGKGFSALEASGGSYWHWSDGSSGTGEILFWNETAQTLNASFDACIRTGYAQPSKLVAVYGAQSQEFSVNSSCTPIAIRLPLIPGKNSVSVHSDAPQFLVATDPRHIVFGVFNWEINSASPEKPQR
jgi:hypothetical protein